MNFIRNNYLLVMIFAITALIAGLYIHNIANGVTNEATATLSCFRNETTRAVDQVERAVDQIEKIQVTFKELPEVIKNYRFLRFRDEPGDESEEMEPSDELSAWDMTPPICRPSEPFEELLAWDMPPLPEETPMITKTPDSIARSDFCMVGQCPPLSVKQYQAPQTSPRQVRGLFPRLFR